MDFRFTEEQDALRELAREILENEVTPERLKQVEAAGDFFDRETWARLADANLLGLTVPEAQGGMGMGFHFDHGGFVNLASGAVTFFQSPLDSTVENGKTLTPRWPPAPV